MQIDKDVIDVDIKWKPVYKACPIFLKARKQEVGEVGCYSVSSWHNAEEMWWKQHLEGRRRLNMLEFGSGPCFTGQYSNLVIFERCVDHDLVVKLDWYKTCLVGAVIE